jgi:hypothetical protein
MICGPNTTDFIGEILNSPVRLQIPIDQMDENPKGILDPFARAGIVDMPLPRARRRLNASPFKSASSSHRRDPARAFALHVSQSQIPHALTETGQFHSIKFIPSDRGNHKSLCIYTPCQFGIAVIKQAIRREQEKWAILIASTATLGLQQLNQNNLFLSIGPHLGTGT